MLCESVQCRTECRRRGEWQVLACLEGWGRNTMLTQQLALPGDVQLVRCACKVATWAAWQAAGQE